LVRGPKEGNCRGKWMHCGRQRQASLGEKAKTKGSAIKKLLMIS